MVGRLDRGWVGAFVTTRCFSEKARREVATDRSPLLMLNGRQVGEAVVKESALRGASVSSDISAIDNDYEARLSGRLPAETLADRRRAVTDNVTRRRAKVDWVWSSQAGRLDFGRGAEAAAGHRSPSPRPSGHRL